MSSVSKAITEQLNPSNAFKGLHHDHSLQINSGGVMNRLQLWKVVSVVLLACGLASAQTITSFSAPGAGTGAGQGTGGFGINPQGTVVGSYLDDGNVFHGYQCVSGCGTASTFTTYNAPGAGTAAGQGTITFSINVFGVITGFLIDANNVSHGFVTTAPFKHFTILNEPDAGQGAGQGTTAGNIKPEGGEIAGSYVDSSGVSHGFVTAPPYRTFTSFDPKGSVATLIPVASALNQEGEVTGTYVDASGAFHGFVRAANGTITEYNVKGAGTGAGQGTSGSSISDLGTTTGNYIDSSGVNHGFVRSPLGDITTFDAPGAGTASGQGTIPATPNLFGVITGQYIDSNNVHFGFIWNP
jgi:hypothetical protein